MGSLVFNAVLLPPNERANLWRSSADYGHAHLYETLFCRSMDDLEFIKRAAQKTKLPILDLAGGGGRIAQALALGGKEVELLDSSESMLKLARRRRENIPSVVKHRFHIRRQQLQTFRLNRKKFGLALSVNHGFDHIAEEDACIEALKQVKACLIPKAKFYLDVHCAKFWEQTLGWKKGQWRYWSDIREDGHCYRVWMRTFPGVKPGAVIWEHAVSSDLKNYHLLRTRLVLRSTEWWDAVLRECGYAVTRKWGSWTGQAASNHLPKLIFELKGRER